MPENKGLPKLIEKAWTNQIYFLLKSRPGSNDGPTAKAFPHYEKQSKH
jgi:hypothetical protein